MKTTRNKAGRPPSPDPCKPLSFRLRSSVAAKAKALGRHKVESAIEAAHKAAGVCLSFERCKIAGYCGVGGYCDKCPGAKTLPKS